jgi:hypothetical protein
VTLGNDVKSKKCWTENYKVFELDPLQLNLLDIVLRFDVALEIIEISLCLPSWYKR